MLNWIKFIAVFLITLVSIMTIIVLYSANKPLSADTELAAEKAMQSGQIQTVQEVQPFNSTSTMMTVLGENKDGEAVAVFVQDTEADQFPEVKLADGISAEKALNSVLKEQKVTKVIHVFLGLENDEPIWEVAFKNEHGKLNYVYIQFQDGDWSRRILNL